MIISLASSLILTIIIESIISLILGIRTKNDFEIVLWVNILTNPVVVFVANCINLLENQIVYNIVVIILEVTAVIVEAFLFKKFLDYKEKSPLLISSINNILSFSLGIIIDKFIF